MRRCAFSIVASMVAILGAGAFLAATPAQAASGAWWHLSSGARPTVLPSAPGETGEVVLAAVDLGNGPVQATSSEPVVIEDQLPAGLELRALPEATAGTNGHEVGTVTCQKVPVGCTFEGTLGPYSTIEVLLPVKVAPGGAGSSELNQATVSGGGTPAAQISRPLAFGEGPTPFGVEAYEAKLEELGGGPTARPAHTPTSSPSTSTSTRPPPSPPPLSPRTSTSACPRAWSATPPPTPAAPSLISAP